MFSSTLPPNLAAVGYATEGRLLISMHQSTEISLASLTLSVPTMTFFNGFIITKTVKATVLNHGHYCGQNMASKHARKHQEHLPLVKEKILSLLLVLFVLV